MPDEGWELIFCSAPYKVYIDLNENHNLFYRKKMGPVRLGICYQSDYNSDYFLSLPC
jgi:hypothetical protein